MPTKNVAEIIIREYSAKWNSVSCGWMEMMDLSAIKPRFVEKKIGEIGDVVIDHLLTGSEGIAKSTMTQIKLPTYTQLLLTTPATTGAPLPLIPSAQYTSLYSKAQTLSLHPTDMGTDTTEDFTFIKAVPVVTLPASSQGKFKPLGVDWYIYHDQAQLLASPPLLVIGYVGPLPS